MWQRQHDQRRQPRISPIASHERRTSTRWLAAGAAAFMLLGACQMADKPSDLIGPDDADAWYSLAAYSAVGQPVSMGNTIRQRSSHQISVRSVKLVGAHGLHVMGIIASRPTVTPQPGRYNMIGAERAFPPTQLAGDQIEINGAPVPPAAADPARLGLSLTFGVRRDTPGRGYATGFDVTYTSDGHRRHRLFHTGIAVCAIAGYNPSPGAPTPTDHCEEVRRS